MKLAKDVIIPSELTTRRSAIFGISGSGKSNTATRLIELLLEAGEQVVLIDPKGEGWGLQTSADGSKAGHDVIVFGQPRGDIEDLREEHAEQIADFVVETGKSVVLSLLGFESDASERRFVTKFFQRLYRRKSQMPQKTRTLVVLEEAHIFIPEQATGGNAEMVGSIKRIARQGRSAGLGLMIVDQRPQDCAKSIVTQSELLICHQLVHKLDRDALRDWTRAYDHDGQGETFLGTLAELQPGEAWIWSPAWLKLFKRSKVDRRKTYDSGATPDGSIASAPKARAKVDLDALRTHLSKVVEQAKANDPSLLKKQLADLNKQLAAAKSVKPEFDQARVDAIVEQARREAAGAFSPHVKQMQESIDCIFKVLHEATTRLDTHRAALLAMHALMDSAPNSKHQAKSIIKITPKNVQQFVPRGKMWTGSSSKPSLGNVRVGVDSPSQKILDALAWWGVVGVENPSVAQVAAVAGYSPNGVSFSTYLSRAVSQQWIVRERGYIAITPQGTQLANIPDRTPTIGELHQRLLGILDGPGRAIMSAVIDAGPDGLTTEEVAQATGYSAGGGSFSTYLSRLSGIGLIERSRGHIKPTDVVFPNGLD